MKDTVSNPTPALTDSEVAMDLGTLKGGDFLPYLTERNSAWVFLPVMALALVFLHLKTKKGLKK